MEITKHARKRLEQRKITLNTGNMDMLAKMVDIAYKKGSREALLMLDNIAFVVNIKNRRLVTVLSKDDMNENIITNVDSVVFA